ncbi:hypothetical protein F2P56_003928 [Juglans regia]|uniref:Uncharacterized protein LOC108982392 n=2 Tax=Juglans regia TaxID=51240 RepID=A0A6P9EGA9_JUGRE|nr:uncharacterized protein LOC108982392 [Juglans regia]XP_035541872.1 uncharacterized protein LOC108982392 [Juglans regia]XP_035541877.1 uncharacterized protein LOC108982392 [Juglans regia]XP_035541882.1 uncharacterized protein LOC108982392 [Juglans regia]KAF5477277.1 hypothetical protein F2P56_003927 [Juglans regia]KAF5477278.1 hypothetical protein F2P56_003928 [Juglans regia]
MAVSFKYWDDCIDPIDMGEMWSIPEVRTEWLDAGESREQKVHLSRDPDGQPYLTQTEMKAVAEIVVRRHFDSRIDLDMICSIAELESDRQPLAMRYDRKTKDTTIGIMQLSLKTAEWLVSELGYRSYEGEGNPDFLFRPFVSIYLGAAYIQWLCNFEHTERSEEFIVRSYKRGPKKATHKSTLAYWKRYLSVKECLPSRKLFDNGPLSNDASTSTTPAPASQTPGVVYTYWDSRASPEDMEELWNHPEVLKEWTKSGERRGKVRFSHDDSKRPYLSRVELKAVAEIILSKHFSTKAVKPTVLCALAEVVNMRFVNGVGPRPGIMGIDYSTAFWLYMELGYKAYRIDSVDDLTKPFVSMYFGAAYLAWLSEYEGRERTPQFVVQAFIAGPKNANLQETGPICLKFQQTLSNYEDTKRDEVGCTIL